MAVSEFMDYATLPWPNYAGKVEVARANAIDGAEVNLTAPDTAWYMIDANGYWDPAYVDVEGQQVFCSQKTGDNTNWVRNQLILPMKKGTAIRLRAAGVASVNLYRL